MARSKQRRTKGGRKVLVRRSLRKSAPYAGPAKRPYCPQPCTVEVKAVTKDATEEIQKQLCTCSDCSNYLDSVTFCIVVNRRGSNVIFGTMQCYMKFSNWTDYHIPSSVAQLKGYASLSKEDRNMISNMLWPNQVKLSMQPKLSLTKYIDEMNKEQLRIELEKRAIDQYVKNASWIEEWDTEILKVTAIQRLEQYLNNDECKQMQQLLVFGYCKSIEKSNKLNIPTYLQRYILRYYPVILYKDQ